MPSSWLNEYRREAFIDFHIGACAKDLMTRFDAKAYVDALVQAGANRHTSFIKDHHGHAYYPTDVGARHPHLKGDLFGDIAAECHRRGLPVMAYYNVTRDGVAFDENPDWRQQRQDGSFVAHRHIKHVCVNSPYTTERVWPMIDETLERYPFVKGFFFDAAVFMPGTCFCEYCKRKMEREGFSPDRPGDVFEFRVRSLGRFIDATTERIRSRVPDAEVYYNTVDFVGKADLYAGQTYMCIESLPSVWGYERTPFFGRYYAAKRVPVAAQTGRFHGGWADYGATKPDAALRYDAALALALGASFVIGDQGAPDAALDPTVYEAERKAFAYYAEREEWAADAESVPYVALLCRRFRDPEPAKAAQPSDFGLLNALTEENVHFDVIDGEVEFDRFAALIVEAYPLERGTAERLREFVQAGGKLIVLGEAAFTGAGGEVVEETLGVEYRGLSPYTAHYFRTAGGELAARLPRSDWVTYGRAAHLKPTDARPLCPLVYPYTEAKPFRTISHKHGHPARVAPYPAATLREFGRGAAAAVACPLGELYYEHAFPPLRIFLKNLLDLLIPPSARVAEFDGPLSSEIRVMRQRGRTVIHLLNFHLNRASRQVRVMEEIPPVLDTEVRLLHRADPERVYLAPDRVPLSWRREGEHIVIPIDRYDTHAMIVIE